MMYTSFAVTLKTKSGKSDKFKGFLVQAWKADATTGDAIGSFAVANSQVQSVCSGSTGVSGTCFSIVVLKMCALKCDRVRLA